MKKTWMLRDAIYDALHRWPSLMLFALAGCLIGWGVSFLWPPSYRATAQIYVALNPYRAYSDSQFLALSKPKYSNLDDYKNWQMAQLESAAYMDEVMQDTLATLQDKDPSWKSMDLDQLKEMLRANWRSAGTWSLVAENADPQRASQAVDAWSIVVKQRVEEAIHSAEEILLVEAEIQAAAENRAQDNALKDELLATRRNLEKWSASLDGLPPDQPLDPAERKSLLSILSSEIDINPRLASLLQELPDEGAPVAGYQAWVSDMMPALSEAIADLEQSLATLEAEQTDLSVRYASEMQKSLGLAPSLVVEGMDQLSPKPIRPVGLIILIGGVIGLLAWILWQIFRISNRFQNP